MKIFNKELSKNQLNNKKLFIKSQYNRKWNIKFYIKTEINKELFITNNRS